MKCPKCGLDATPQSRAITGEGCDECRVAFRTSALPEETRVLVEWVDFYRLLHFGEKPRNIPEYERPEKEKRERRMRSKEARRRRDAEDATDAQDYSATLAGETE